MVAETLDQITTLAVFHFMLVFSRIGTALLFIPGIGEIYIPAPSRLGFALATTFLVLPFLQPSLPPVPANGLELFLQILAEVIIGGFIGSICRMIHATLHVAGMIFAFQSSLASALLFDASQGSQGSVLGNFMTLLGLALLFATNMHHVIITGIVDSYTLFDATIFPPIADLTKMATEVITRGFIVAIKISSPLIVIGIIINFAAGLMSRLMPTMQVFFIMVPLQIYVSFAIIMVTIAGGMVWYLRFFEDTIALFLH